MQFKNNKQKLISLKEAAEMFGYAPDYIGFLIRTGKIPGKKIYARGVWRVSRSSISRYAKNDGKNVYKNRWKDFFGKRYISLKEATEISGYASDYIGQLIREGKVSGKKIYSEISWMTTSETIQEYKRKKEEKNNIIILLAPLALLLRKGFYFWLKEERKILTKWFSLKTPKYGVVSIILGIIIFSSLAVFAFTPKIQTQTAKIYSTQSGGEWQGAENVQGPPQAGPDGGLDSFSELNSAVYQSGPLSLVLDGFNFLQDDSIKITNPAPDKIEDQPAEQPIQQIVEPTQEPAEEGEVAEAEEEITKVTEEENVIVEPTQEQGAIEDAEDAIEESTTTEELLIEEEQIENQPEPDAEEQTESNPEIDEGQNELPPAETTFPESEPVSLLEKMKNFFGKKTVRAQNIVDFEELTQNEFVSAKIKFSLAIGEKQPDILIIDPPAANTELLSTSTYLESSGSYLGCALNVFGKIKNFFIALGERIGELARSFKINDPLIVRAEEITKNSTSALIGDIPEITIPEKTSEPLLLELPPLEEDETTTTDTADDVIVDTAPDDALNDNDTEINATTTDITSGTTTEDTTEDTDETDNFVEAPPAISEATTAEAIIEDIIPDEGSTDEVATSAAELLANNIDARIFVWWSIDGEAWQVLTTISDDNISNALNPSAGSGQAGGYFSYDAPFLKNWEDIKNLKLKFEGVVGGETVVKSYLDSAWVEVDYQESEDEDEEIELRPIKKDWQASEEPEFEIVNKEPKKQGLIKKLLADASSALKIEEVPEPTVVAKADLDEPNNRKFQLKEGKDFDAVLLSENKIKIFKPENFRPGLHTLTIDIVKNGKTYTLEQDFTWGVLAINVNKSIYLPGDEAYLQMGVLDDMGRTLCDADLSLEITAPDGTKKIFETSAIISEPVSVAEPEQDSNEEEIPEETAGESVPEILDEIIIDMEATTTETIITEVTTTDIIDTASSTPASSSEEAAVEEATSTEAATTEATATENQINDGNDIGFKEKVNKFLGVPAAKAQEYIGTGVIQKNPECGPNSVTYTPDYWTYYKVKGAGVYQLKLTAVTKNGIREITDSFEVRDSVPFDVERIGPTRIYPPASYEMKMIIKVNQDFQGEVIESVPASFDVFSAELTPISTLNNAETEISENQRINQRVSAEITAANNEKLIVWNTSLEKGNIYELKYQFDAPDISPYLYLLGPLEFYE